MYFVLIWLFQATLSSTPCSSPLPLLIPLLLTVSYYLQLGISLSAAFHSPVQRITLTNRVGFYIEYSFTLLVSFEKS